MWKYLEVVNPEAFTKMADDLRCKDVLFSEVDSADFQIPPSHISPPDGFSPKENFPNCCNFHKHVYNTTTDWFNKFPECCSGHKKLLSTKWFDKSRYKETVNKVCYQLEYTGHILTERINYDDWYVLGLSADMSHKYTRFGSIQLNLNHGISNRELCSRE